ncbi:uncharacterized protein ACNLHF_001575 isoform 2-T2 [Anomaloglossus baeobatrachus]|uniref:uncharacterized protein LOC142257011 isoform X2 n=1 Tax=Anomaloglossus baeobatrachus TaxID=238106 RepID=UPI003F4FA5F1
MAIIADDSPAKEKESPAEIIVTVNETPANEGFCTDKTTKVFPQPCYTEPPPEKELLAPPEISAEPELPGLVPVQKKVKKKRQRKRKSKKIKAVLLVKGPRAKPGILSGKFHLKLPKKAVGNRLLLIALCSILSFQLAQSVIICILSVPVPDFPFTVSHNNHMVTFQEPTFCPERVHISDSCSACFEEASFLDITCSNAADIKIWGEPRKGNEVLTFVRMTSEGGNCIMKKSQNLHKKRSVESSPQDDLKEICTTTVPVTNFPIVFSKSRHIFNNARFCPETVEVMKISNACFKDLTLLEISCRKIGNEDFKPFWVEHGKGRGKSSRVDMNSAVCHKMMADESQIQSYRSDGGTSTEVTEGNKGRSLQSFLILGIPIFWLAIIFVFM